jgi:hypothetical protein
VSDRERWLFLAGLVATLILYFALALPLVARQGVHWDEQTDLEVAASYLEGLRGPFDGSPIDVINVRVPTFFVAMLDPLGLELGVRNARLVSCAVGGLAIVGVALFCVIALDVRKALLAAAILAISPYFLAFAPLAFTEGDVFITCALAWVLVAGELFRRSGVWGHAWLLGAALGLALSSKLSAVALLPAVALTAAAPWRPAPRGDLRSLAPLVGILAAFGLWLLAQVLATGALDPPGGRSTQPVHPLLRAYWRYLAIVAIWVGLVAWIGPRRSERVPVLLRPVLPLLVAGVTFFVVPPVHTTNPLILSGLLGGMIGGAGDATSGFMTEAAALHLGVTLLKPGLVVGLALWLATLRAGTRFRSRPELRLPIASFAFYVAFLLTLPWAQIRYMLPPFALMAIFGADAFVDLARRRRIVAAGVAVVALASLGWDYRLTYPDLSLNGYQWVGERYLAGRSTLGYRGIAQVGEDGVEQALDWTLDNVEPGSRMASYVLARHVVRAVLEDAPFDVIDGLSEPRALERADYVITSLNGDIRAGEGNDDPEGEVRSYPVYDRDALEREFVRAFSVRRAFDIEVASVWRRRDGSGAEASPGRSPSSARSTPTAPPQRER